MSVLPAAGDVSFARGIPGPDLLPLERLAECTTRAVERHGRVALNYGPPAGFEPLREWIADRHGVARSRVIVTPGSLMGMGFLVRHLQGPAFVETPTYDRMLAMLRAAGTRVVADPEQAAFAYVLPTFHNPTGRTLTLAERERLADLATERELLLVEDDPYGLLRFEGEPLPHVHALLRDRGADQLAVFMSSFSKSVAPGLRVGYLVLPDALVEPIQALATATYVSPPLLAQAQLYEFLAGGHLEPHLAEARARLRLRRDALLEGLAGTAALTRPEGGYFLWADLPVDAAALAERARAAGVPLVPGAGFFPDGGGERTARLAFSLPTPEQIADGAARLAALIRAPAG